MEAFKNVFTYFWPIWFKAKGHMIILIVLTLFTALIQTTYPILLKDFLAGIQTLTQNATETEIDAVYQLVYLILPLSFAVALMKWWVLPVYRAKLNFFFAKEARLDLLAKVLRKRPAFYLKYNQGDLLTRLTDDIDNDTKIEWYSCSGVMRPVEAIFVFVLAASFMAYMHWQLMLWSLLPIPLVVLLISKTKALQKRLYNERQQRTSDTVTALTATFTGIRIVLTYVIEKAQYALMSKTLDDRENSEINVVTMQTILEGAGQFLNRVSMVIVLIVGGLYVLDGSLEIEQWVAFILYLDFLTPVVWTLSWFFVSTNLVNASVMRHQELMNEEDRVEGTQEVSDPQALSIHKLSYAWEEAKPLLKKLSLTLRRGQMIAVVGKVGCGKSTLLKLCAGMLPLTDESVKVGAVSLNQLTSASRAESIAFVPQKNQLFSGSVEENISLLREGVTREMVERALKQACVSEEFTLDREIREGGESLSGGQKARMALARVLVTRPHFLLLDDVTASLDADTEDRFWNNINEDRSHMGLLVATHREVTAQIADEVVWLDDGMIRARGRHDALLNDSEYQKLFARHS